MKHHVKLPSRGASSSSSPPPVHRLSHAIAKAPAPAPPRKVRITHVLAPQIIKTEARHFRELVQMVTGKPPKKRSCSSSAASTGADASPSPSPPNSVSSCVSSCDEGAGGTAAGIGMMKVVKEEAAVSSLPPAGEDGGFLRAFELDGYYDDDGFYQGLQDFLASPCDMDGVPGGFDF